MSERHVVLITGGRHYTDFRALFAVLDRLHSEKLITRIVQGKCPFGGADLLGEIWAHFNNVPCESFPPRIVNGIVRGPERNQRMVDATSPDVCVRCKGGGGTADCAFRASQAGARMVPVPEGASS